MTKFRKMILRPWMSDRGVTIMELMVTVVIAGILSAMAIPRFSLEIERVNFKSSSRDLLSNLRVARSLAISQRESHGVYFSPSSGEYTLFLDRVTSVPPSFDESSVSVPSAEVKCRMSPVPMLVTSRFPFQP